MKALYLCPRATWVLVSLILMIKAGSVLGQSPWINEFHYDNAGTDRGEFIEVVVPEGFSDVSALRVTLYNGGDGRPYGLSHLLDSFTLGETVAGYSVYSKSIGSIQNGPADGMSLDLGGSVLQFLSYEGAFQATAGPAIGLSAFDVGVGESDVSSPEGGSLGLGGQGGSGSAFLWTVMDAATPGGWNTGQTLVPEPGPMGLLALGGMILVARYRRAGNDAA